MEKLFELFITETPQNVFLELLNRLCTIEPTDTEEEIKNKKSKLLGIMMLRVKAEVEKKAETDEELAQVLRTAEEDAARARFRKTTNDLIKDVKNIINKEDEE